MNSKNKKTIPVQPSASKFNDYYLTNQKMSLTPEDDDDMVIKQIVDSVPVIQAERIDKKIKKDMKNDDSYWVQQRQAEAKARAKGLVLETTYFVIRKNVIVTFRAHYKTLPFWCFKPFILMRIINAACNPDYGTKVEGVHPLFQKMTEMKMRQIPHGQNQPKCEKGVYPIMMLTASFETNKLDIVPQKVEEIALSMKKFLLQPNFYYHFSQAAINAYENKKFESLAQKPDFDLYRRLPQAEFRITKGTFLDQLFLDEDIAKMIKTITNDSYPMLIEHQDVLQYCYKADNPPDNLQDLMKTSE